MATIAALIVDVAANTANIDRSTRQINTQLDSISSTASKMAKGLAAAFTISAVVDAGKAVLDYAGKIADMSARLQVSTTTIQEWEAAFSPAGVSIDTVAKSAAELANKITGNDKSAVAALKAMGLNLNELKTMSPEAQFNKVADAVGNLQNNGERIYASKTLFGKGGVELLSALDGKLQENIQSFNDLGLIIDEQTIKAADDFGDQLGMMGKQLLGITAAIIGPLLPALSALGNVLMWLGREVIGPVLNVAIKSAMWLIFEFIEQVSKVTIAIAEQGAKLPVVGKYFAQYGDLVQGMQDTVKGLQANLWKQKDATDGAGEASAKAAPKLIGLGDASGDAADKHAKQARELANLKEKIADIDASTRKGLWAPTAADLSDSLDNYIAGLQQFADARAKAFDIERGAASGGVWTIGIQLDTEAAQSALATLNAMASKTFTGILSSAVSSLPKLVQQAMTGGGGLKGAAQALMSQIGGGLGEGLFNAGGALNGIGNKLTGMFGSAFGLALPGIGSAIGSVLGPVMSKLASKLFNDPEKQINPIRQAFVNAAGGIEMLNLRAHDAGITLDHLLDARTPEAYKRAIDELNAAFEFQDKAMQTLNETVKKYNFTNEQIGPTLQRQELGKKFEELFQDYKVLQAGGVDQVAITQQMSQAVSKYVQDARRMGIEIPAAMRPMLENFAANGDLIDENGNAITDVTAYGVTFAESMTESVAKIIASVQQLVDAIERGLGAAIRNIPQPVINGRVKWEVDPVPGGGGGRDGYEDTPRAEPFPMALGGAGFAAGPMLFSTKGNEEFAFSGEGKRFARKGDSAEVLNFSELKAELAALRQQQAETNTYFQSMFPRDLARVMTSEQQKRSAVRR